MQYQKSLLAVGAMLSLTAINTQAALTSYNANGVDLVYSSVSDLSWTKDANLLGTLESTLGFNTVVNAIIAASPIINDTPNIYDTPSNSGHHAVSASDFNSSSLGLTSWFGAKAFANYLNSINYGGSSQWRLPSAGSNPQYGFNLIGSEFGQLFYTESGGTAHNNIPNTGTFSNVQPVGYWSGTEYSPDANMAWGFSAGTGVQGNSNKGNQLPVWAVTPGQVAAVPVPSAIWLFGSAWFGFMGWKQRRYIHK